MATRPKSVNLHQAKTHLSRLVDAAVAGQGVVIAKAGKPMVRLVPFEGPQRPRKLGRYAGQIRIAADFDRLPEDMLQAFEGSGP
jgi:prevent-host-death family protein